jgi:hypothetical protein
MSTIITVQKKNKKNMNINKMDKSQAVNTNYETNLINPVELISNFTEADNVKIKLAKKIRPEGEYTQIIIDKSLEDIPDSKFNKLALKTLNKKNNGAYCKIRVNDNHRIYINKLYKENYFTQFKNKISVEQFNDQNAKEHTNLIIETSVNNKFYEFYQNIITMINIINTINEISINTDNSNASLSSVSGSDSVIKQSDFPPLVNSPASVAAPVMSPAAPAAPTTVSIVNSNPVINTRVPEQLSAKEIHNPPMHKMAIPIFDTITPATLDTEARYIEDLERHITFLQRNLNIMKETHEINIKCYNDRVAIHNKFLGELPNPEPIANPTTVIESVDKDNSIDSSSIQESKDDAKE